MINRQSSRYAVVIAAHLLLQYSCYCVARGQVDDIGIDTLADDGGQSSVECGIWLAPSTIIGAGLGMFAGRDFDAQEELLHTGDSMVPIYDYRKNMEAQSKLDQTFLWDEYTWTSDAMLANHDGYFHVDMSSPGFGSAANSFIPIYNVEEWYAVKDSTGLHRSRDPGAGGFSPYHDRKSTAKFPISKGDELFVTYSAVWFESRPHFGPIPVGDNFDDAQTLVESFKGLRGRIGEMLSSQVWDVFVKGTSFSKSRIIGTFHHSDPDEMEILTKENITIEELRKDQSRRSLSWLEEHGTCGDHITPKKSTFPQAGRGAFATRNIPKGTFVAQLPMVHIADRSVLEMYHSATVETEYGNSFQPSILAGKMGYQLLLNYCYGHNQSSLLLCPYGPMTNYINHNQSLANVKLSWGRPESGNHDSSLLLEPVESFAQEHSAKLAMELVAIRDITEGEEVFLDYGDEWEESWQNHVSHWQPLEGADLYKAAADFNSDLQSRLPTVFEQLEESAEPFPPNVGLKCDHVIADQWRAQYEAGTYDFFLQFHNPDFWPCEILRFEEDNGNYLYTVHMHKQHDTPDTTIYHEIGYDLPRIALRFHDMPYTHDAFLPNAFRHDIRIPDDMFPQAWMNLKD